MRKFWCLMLAAFVILFTAPALAQESQEDNGESETAQEEEEQDEGGFTRMGFGGFGFFSPGVFIGDFELLSRDLARSDSLGATADGQTQG